MASQVAVVTGSNKGIGLAIVRALCRHFGKDGVVYLTARDEGRGKAAVELLQKEGLNPKFHVLDVTDQSSIDKLRAHLEKEHGGIDVLVNNAGIGPVGDSHLYEHAVRVIGANFFGVLEVSRSLIPLVRSGGRIVHVASWGGYETFRNGMNDDVRGKFRQAKCEKDVVDLMNEFLESRAKSNTTESGWTESLELNYGVSKLGVIVLCKIQAQMITGDTSRDHILVNACCPGLVRTDMTAFIPEENDYCPKITPDEGVDTPVYLALLPPGTKEPNGQFVMRRKVYDFINTDVVIPLYEAAE